VQPASLGLAWMNYRRHGYEEAEAEARRIAEAFVKSEVRDGGRWSMECGQPEPDQEAPGFDRRKRVIRWRVFVRPIPKDGSVIDGGEGY
jgi:hypothetical protein